MSDGSIDFGGAPIGTRFIPANIFATCGISDPFPAHLARWRRLLVTLWLLHDGSRNFERSTLDDAAAARAVWDVHVDGLKRSARVTVVSVLAQLKGLGFVRSFDAVEGGYAVELVKEGPVN